MPVPNTFANATATIPLSQLDANFATTITLGNTAIQLGNTVSTLNNMTLANVTVTSGNVTITNVTVTTANVTTANIATAVITTANVTTANITTGNVSGNLTFTGTGNRITGDFSNATVANRVMFQTSTVNGLTSLDAMPNGTSQISVFNLWNSSDPINAARMQVGALSTEARLLTDKTGTGTFLPMTFYTGGSERMRLDSSGNLGLGVTPSAWRTSGDRALQIGSWMTLFTDSGVTAELASNTYVSSASQYVYANNGFATRYRQYLGQHAWFTAASGTAGNAITFTQAMTLDANGNLGIGTTSPSYRLQVESGSTATGGQAWSHSAGTVYARIGVVNPGVANDTEFGAVTNNSLRLITNNAERARITETGNFCVNKTDTTLSVAGLSLGADNTARFTKSASAPLEINRLTSDGILVLFYQDTVAEGNISVAGNTVSYNPFLGSHAGAFADWSRPEVKIGTIFETINELIDYKVVVIEVPEEVPATEETEATTVNVPKRISYNGNGAVGTTATVEYEGQEYTGIIENERGQLRDFNKHVKVKINDTPDSKAVYGVFVGWNTDLNNDGGVYNDMLIGAVGNYVIRMAAGQTPEIGDLVKADGTGCAIVQEDDIVRTKTVGKITNTIPQLTYEDGSFLVACVLYCG